MQALQKPLFHSPVGPTVQDWPSSSVWATIITAWANVVDNPTADRDSGLAGIDAGYDAREAWGRSGPSMWWLTILIAASWRSNGETEID
jgi:hypothetical protein